MTLSASGPVTQTVAITGQNLVLQGSGTFTLTDVGNNFATLSASGTPDISYANSGPLALGSIAIGAHKLTLSGAGSVTQTAAISGQDLLLQGTGTYTLTNSGNNFSTLTASGTNDIAYANNGALTLGSVALGLHKLTLNAAGSVSQSAAISGQDLVLQGSAAYSLTNAGNSFATLTANTTSDIAYTNGGALALGSVAVGAHKLTLNATGPVTQTAAITGKDLVLLGAAYTLTNGGNSFATLTANTSNDLSYTNTGALALGSIAIGAHTLALSSSGAVTQTAAISGQDLVLQGAGKYTLTNAANSFSTLAASSTNDVSYANNGALAVGNIALGAHNLSLSASGPVTQLLGAAISGAGLELLGPGSFVLTNAANDFTTLAANTGNSISYLDANALAVGTVNATSGISAFNSGTATAFNVSLQTGGALTFTSGITASANVTLNAGGAVTQSAGAGGRLVGNGLELLGAGPVTLNNALGNSFSVLAANVTGAVSYRAQAGLTIGTVNGTIGLSSAGSNINLQTGGALTIGAAIQTGPGNLTITSGGAVTQSAPISGAGLELHGSGSFTLTNGSNDFGVIAADTTGGISYRDANALTVGAVGAASGISSGGANVSLQAGSISISNAIATGAGNLTLNSSGAVAQTATITGAGLELLGSGSFALQNGANDFTTIASSATGPVSYADASDLAVGTVNGTSGINSGGGNVILAAGNLAIANGIAVGTGNLTLSVSGSTTQSASITGNGLELLGGGPFTLTNAGNDFNTLAASTTGVIAYTDANSLTVGPVNRTIGINTGGNDVSILVGSDLTIASNITAVGANVVLSATAGTVTQTTGAVSSKGFALVTFANPILSGLNSFQTFAARVTGAGNVFSQTFPSGVQIGTVGSVSGISTNNGAITILGGAGDISLLANVNAGTAEVGLGAFAGKVVESGGVVIGSGLAIVSQNTASLTGLNQVGVFSGNILGAGQGVTFVNTGALSVGTVMGVFGVTASGDVGLQAGGALALNAAVSAGPQTVRLVSMGDITQNAAGVITAGALGVRNENAAGGNILLTQLNQISSLAAFNNTSAASILVSAAPAGPALTVTGVTGLASGSFNFTATDGISASGNATVAVASSGGLSITSAINAPDGTVYLKSAGDLVQSGAGVISANALALNNASALSGHIALDLANRFNTLAAVDQNAVSGGIFVRTASTGVLTLGQVGPITSGGLALPGADGLSSAGGDITVVGGGAISIARPLSAGVGDVRLVSNGSITQATTGIISAGGFGFQNLGASGDVILEAANQLGIGGLPGTVSGLNAAPGGVISIKNSTLAGLDVGTLSAVMIGPVTYFPATAGLTTTAAVGGGNSISIQTTGTLGLSANIVAPGADVLLHADAGVIETTGAVQSKDLAVTSTGLSMLGAGNSVETVSALVTGPGADFIFANLGALKIGAVGGLNGVVTNGGPAVLSALTGDLTLVNGVNAGPGYVELYAAGGGVNEAGGVVSANALLVQSLTSSTLTGANNINALTAEIDSAAQSFTFVNAGSFNVDALGVLSGIKMIGGGDINLSSGSALAIKQALDAGAGTVRLVSHGDITQTAAGGITAASLNVRNENAAGNILLNQANNFASVATSNAAPGAQTIVVNSNAGLTTIDSVSGFTAPGGFAFQATTGLNVAGGSFVGLQAAGGVLVNAAVSAANSTVYLRGFGDLSQTNGQNIVANLLGVRNDAASGTINLASANNLGAVAAFSASANGGIVIDAAGSSLLTIGGASTVASGNFNFTGFSGVVSTAGNDIGLKSGGDLSIAAPVNAGSGNVRLLASGNVGETGTGSIVASAVGVHNVNTTGGNIVLVANLNAHTVATANDFAGGKTFLASADPTGMSIGSVSGLASPADFNFTAVSGLSGAGSAVIGVQSAGALTVTAPIANAGGSVFLSSRGDLTQTAAGTISAALLGAHNENNSAGVVSLAFDNQVGSLAIANANPGAAVTFVDAGPGQLTIDSAVFTDPSFNFASTTGASSTGGGAINLQSGGGLELHQSINAGVGTVRLVVGGDAIETGSAIVQASTLGIRNDNGTVGDINLDHANQVSSLAALNSAVGHSINFVNAGALNIVSLGGQAINHFNFQPIANPSSNNGNVTFTANTGNLTISKTISAGSGDVSLIANAGTVIENGAGVTAHGLAIQALNSPSLNFGANAVDVIAANITGAGQDFVYLNGPTLTVGSVNGIDGITTNNGNAVLIVTGGDLLLSNKINAGTADVALISSVGTVTENPGGAVIAGGLLVESFKSPSLTGNDAIQRLAARVTGPGDFTLVNAAGLTIGTVYGVDGIVTANGNINLTTTTGDLLIQQQVNAGAQQVNLTSVAGAIQESGSGSVTAGTLSTRSATGTTLDTTNSVAKFTAVNQTSGDISLTDNVGSLELDAITQSGPGNVTITNSGTLNIAGLISDPGTGLVSLSGSSIQETGAGLVAATNLETISVSGSMLTAGNLVGHYSAVNTGAGDIQFQNAQNLVIDSVKQTGGNITIGAVGSLTVGGAINGNKNLALNSTGGTAVNGPVVMGGDAMVQAGGALTVSKSIKASKNVSLTSGGGQTISAAVAAGSGFSLVTLNSGSPIAINGPLSAGGNGNVQSAGALTVGGPITTGGLLKLTAAGDESINGLITVGGQLQATNGPGGNIVIGSTVRTGGNAIVQTGGALTVTGPVNAGGSISFSAGRSETISAALTASGAVTLKAGTVANVNNSITAGGVITVASPGTVTVNGVLTAGGDINLSATAATSDVLVKKEVKAGGVFTVMPGRDTILYAPVTAGSLQVGGQIIEARDNLTATAGDLDLHAQVAIYLDGTAYGGVNVLLNADQISPRLPSPFSSIIFTNPNLATITATGAFTTGYLQKTISFGSLTINAGTATFGDLAARHALTVSAGQITLLDRPADGSSSGSRHDQGLSIVAGTIDFSGSMSFSGLGNGKAFFAVASGHANVPRIDGTTFFVDGALDSQFTQPTGEPASGFAGGAIPLLPTQPISGGVVDAEVIAALAGALPEQRRVDLSPEAKISAATVAKLLSLGVTARDPDAEEKKWIKAKRALFKQLLAKLNPTDADFQVVVNRISPAQVAYILDKYDRIFGPNQENKPHIEELFKTEYDKYVEKTNALDAGGFGDFLLQSGRKDHDATNAMAIVGQFRELFTDLGKVGFTPREIQIAQDVMARSLNIEGLSPIDFLALVGVPRPQPAAPPEAIPPATPDSAPVEPQPQPMPPPDFSTIDAPAPAMIPAPVGLGL